MNTTGGNHLCQLNMVASVTICDGPSLLVAAPRKAGPSFRETATLRPALTRTAFVPSVAAARHPPTLAPVGCFGNSTIIATFTARSSVVLRRRQRTGFQLWSLPGDVEIQSHRDGATTFKFQEPADPTENVSPRVKQLASAVGKCITHPALKLSSPHNP